MNQRGSAEENLVICIEGGGQLLIRCVFLRQTSPKSKQNHGSLLRR